MDDIDLVSSCLQAAVKGPFFPDWEFETLFGLTRAEVSEICERWPSNADEQNTEAAVHTALAHLCGYPHGQRDELEKMVLAPIERVQTLWKTVTRLQPPK